MLPGTWFPLIMGPDLYAFQGATWNRCKYLGSKGSAPVTRLISNGREEEGRSWADGCTQQKRVWHVFMPQALEVVVDGLTKILWCSRGKKLTSQQRESRRALSRTSFLWPQQNAQHPKHASAVVHACAGKQALLALAQANTARQHLPVQVTSPRPPFLPQPRPLQAALLHLAGRPCRESTP